MRVDAGGLLRFAGRNDFQIKLNGIRFETEEIEQQLLGAPGVEDVSVIISKDGDLIVFAAVPSGPGDAVEVQLRDRLRTTLPRGLQPARLHVVNVRGRRFPWIVEFRAGTGDALGRAFAAGSVAPQYDSRRLCARRYGLRGAGCILYTEKADPLFL